jgi:O-succinylbenzoic acid--CoA ligase
VETTLLIDWTSEQSHVLLNPRLPDEERARLERLAASIDLHAHVWIASSGTTGALKLIALSRRALLASAAAVNERLEATKNDVWCCVLPSFHVGGLGIQARAYLTGSRLLSMTWSAQAFAATDATLASLVPAQVHDLVSEGLTPPRRMRAVLVGGGVFDSDLCSRAQALGWPVLPSYGMSECCSTVSVREVLLPHLEARRENDGRLAFRGASLFSGYATEEGFFDPKVEGWFISDDVGEVDGRVLRVQGRRGEIIKIGGESVDLGRLDRVLDSVRGTVDAAIVALGDDRLGTVIHLVATVDDVTEIVERFNAQVLPFERIRGVHVVSEIPRTSLQKLMRSRLRETLERR